MPTTNKYARHSAPRKASDAPLTVEVLSCQGGMAMSRFDFTEAYRIFQLLLQRYGEAKYDAERIRVLEALYHTTDYEARGHMSWQQQCHQMFDDLVTDSPVAEQLLTDRLLFYRFCPDSDFIPSPHKKLHTEWINRLRLWADQLADSDDSLWDGVSLCNHFLRQRYIADTGYKEVAGHNGRAEKYEQHVRSSFFESLLMLMRSVNADVPTHVAAYRALRCLMSDFEKEERRYKQFITRVRTIQVQLPRDTNRWIQLEELKEDYANLEPIFLTHAKTGRVYRTI